MACVLNPSIWIYLIFMIGFIAILRIVVPWFIGFFGVPAPIGQIILIVLWCVIAAMGVYFLFELLSCAFSGGGLNLPRIGR